MEKVIRCILVGVIVVIGTLYMSDGCSHKKEVKRLEGDIVLLNERYINCLNAHKETDTIRDTVYMPGEVIEVPVAIDSHFVVIDTVYERTYEDKTMTKDFEIDWTIVTLGELKRFRVNGYKLFSETIVETITIIEPGEKVFVSEYRSGWYLTAAIGNNFSSLSSWSSIEGGLGYTTRKGVGFGLDYQYGNVGDNFFRLGKVRFNYQF